jgi:hypothetical protein
LLGRLQLRVAEAYIRALFRGDSLNAGTEKPRDRHENLEQKAIMTLTTRARYHRPTGRRVYRASKATASAFSNSREGRWYGTAGKRRTEEENWSRSVFQLMGEALTWIIHDLTGEKRKDALKGVMNTGFWRTRHSLSEHPRDDILLYTTAFFFLLPTPTHSR